ncbi:chromosome segregation protein [Carpediemonas membranifera]|uniref:Chromosome segregation protein n=1 Tax=Carpediemonas membranifera TaxID=201153 RepID=A0A8J6E440_9EUKA|nr:chromosome segregation protein [Carpediemonas membranifera]|eukprot:KAG9396401.1 chromosome segregation protein [Carpediemonas membranifera]
MDRCVYCATIDTDATPEVTKVFTDHQWFPIHDNKRSFIRKWPISTVDADKVAMEAFNEVISLASATKTKSSKVTLGVSGFLSALTSLAGTGLQIDAPSSTAGSDIICRDLKLYLSEMQKHAAVVQSAAKLELAKANAELAVERARLEQMRLQINQRQNAVSREEDRLATERARIDAQLAESRARDRQAHLQLSEERDKMEFAQQEMQRKFESEFEAHRTATEQQYEDLCAGFKAEVELIKAEAQALTDRAEGRGGDKAGVEVLARDLNNTLASVKRFVDKM